jgi:hypothetical protein
MGVVLVAFADWVRPPLIERLFGRNPSIRQVTPTGTRSAARSRTSGNIIFGVRPERNERSHDAGSRSPAQVA